MADNPGNILSLQLPTDLLTGSGGNAGLNLSYNFGPNVDTIAQGAYGFLNQSFATADKFQATSIQGTQDFVAAGVAPLVNAVASEQDDFFSQLLGVQSSTAAQMSAIASQSMQIQQALGNQSMRVSKKAAKSGSIFGSIFGGCFITTAVCKYTGKPDDCYELQTMRAWRDSWMQETEERREMVARYYDVAPTYVEGIERLPALVQKIVYTNLSAMIDMACWCVHHDMNDVALAFYLAAVEFARVASGVDHE